MSMEEYLEMLDCLDRAADEAENPRHGSTAAEMMNMSDALTTLRDQRLASAPEGMQKAYQKFQEKMGRIGEEP